MILPDAVLEHFGDVVDVVAFLDGTYTEDGLREARLVEIVAAWCAEQTSDPDVARLVELRQARREASPAARNVARPEPAVASDVPPIDGQVCPDCGRNGFTPRGLAIHRARQHKPSSRAKNRAGEHRCPDCDFVSTRPQGLSRHRKQQHGTPTAKTSEPLRVPGFDGNHRLAHERRAGHQVEAFCACGESSGATDREDARSWLHQHIEAAA